MKVVFIGRSKGQPLLMQEAMRRRGHEVFVVDPYVPLRENRLLLFWTWHTGALVTATLAERYVRQMLRRRYFDVAFIDNGEIVSPSLVQYLKSQVKRVVLFNRDNPFVPRDGQRWRTLLSALPQYDLFVTPRQSTAEKARSFGAQAVLRVNFFADEILHRPGPPTADELALYGSPVSFVGTWFPERGPFMEQLINRGVPLKIIGNRWNRAANYSKLKNIIVPGYLSPEKYSAAIRSAKIAIAMLSKGNEDVQTSRSSEIPAMGVLMCAERTDEHLKMYDEDREAVFWSSAEECADKCLALLANPERLNRIAEAGRARALKNDNWTEPTMERILQTAIANDHEAALQ